MCITINAVVFVLFFPYISMVVFAITLLSAVSCKSVSQRKMICQWFVALRFTSLLRRRLESQRPPDYNSMGFHFHPFLLLASVVGGCHLSVSMRCVREGVCLFSIGCNMMACMCASTIYWNFVYRLRIGKFFFYDRFI